MRYASLTLGLLIGCTSVETQPDDVTSTPPEPPITDPMRPESIGVTPEPGGGGGGGGTPIKAVVATSRTHCAGSAIDVGWSQLPGNANDWIAIAPAGSAPGTFSQRVYTNGALHGTASFTAPPPGKYVARAYLDDSSKILAEFWFWVVSITADRAAYVAGDPITLTWAGLPGGSGDWVGLTPENAVPPTISVGAYTNHPSGSHVFTLATSGTFVARAFENDDTYNIVCESAPFVVGSAP
jgi:hypothetical protein